MKKNKEESTCCKSSFKTVGDETKHYRCLRCSQSCDVAVKKEKSFNEGKKEITK